MKRKAKRIKGWCFTSWMKDCPFRMKAAPRYGKVQLREDLYGTITIGVDESNAQDLVDSGDAIWVETKLLRKIKTVSKEDK